MDVHQNARTTPHGRRLMIERLAEGWSVARLAAAAGVTAKTVGKWRDRHALEGEVGLLDRSSRPHRSPTRLPDSAVAEIIQLRRQRLSGPAIARRLGRPVSTVGLVLRRHRLARLRLLDPKPEIIRYQRDRPGELIHLDIKKLGRIDGVGHRPHRGRSVSVGAGAGRRRRRITGDRRGQKKGIGWECLHVCVDDASRLAYTEILPNERKTSLREWAYLQAFANSAERAVAMRPWLHRYNRHRPHSALGGKPPSTRLTKDNLLGNDN